MSTNSGPTPGGARQFGNRRGRGSWYGRGRGGWRGRGGYNKNRNVDDQRTGGRNQNAPEQPESAQLLRPAPKSGPKQVPISELFTPVPGRYKAWKLYHPMEEYNIASPTVNKVMCVEKFIERHRDSYSVPEVEEQKAFNLDMKDLLGEEAFMADWPDFASDLSDRPEHTLGCMSLAMHQFVLSELEKEAAKEEGISEINLPMIKVRLINYEPITRMKHLAANTYGKLVSVRGTVIRVGNIKLLCTWLAFSCSRCDSVQCVQQEEGAYTLPTSCTRAACQSRSFAPLCSSPYTQTVNWQTVRLQEILADDQRDGGRVPRTVECELIEELVDCCLPGDVVTITGIVKIRSGDEGHAKKGKAPSIFLIYVEGRSIVNSKKCCTGNSRSKQSLDVEFTTDDYYAIQEIQSSPVLFRLAVNSLCPSIYGHEMVKAGLLLGLLGGAQGQQRRGDSHVLVVGDPGLGKSQMLQACSTIAPRGVYVCGNTSSSSGLTVTLTREGGGNYALEAGALVLADQGCCCIDEFDKMSTQHQALLEAMEQQVISISKAGVICTLPARTSILAAANPVSGHYNRAKTVSENLRLGSALLSRFDLVFILQDRPDEHLDSLLSEHVMALYSGLKQPQSDTLSLAASDRSGCTLQTQNEATDPALPLSKRLKLCPGESVDVIPSAMLRKYIAYAKKYIPSPQLSPEAAAILQKFYLDLRRQHQTLDSTPITMRQLESLIRLTQARAKLELREVATALDAIEVVELMRWSMVDTFTDDFGGLDFHRSQHGSGMSTKNQAKRFVSILQRQAEQTGHSLFTVNEMKEQAARSGIVVGDFFTFLSSLNNQGFLLKKGKNQYQLLSVDY